MKFLILTLHTQHTKCDVHETPSSGRQVVPCGQTTDEHNGAISRFSQTSNAPEN